MFEDKSKISKEKWDSTVAEPSSVWLAGNKETAMEYKPFQESAVPRLTH
jgi:hypothetical protein